MAITRAMPATECGSAGQMTGSMRPSNKGADSLDQPYRVPATNHSKGGDIEMQTSTILVLEVGAIGALLCGVVGMTIWKDKGGSPSTGLIIGVLLGLLGVIFLSIGKPGQKEINRVARSRAR